MKNREAEHNLYEIAAIQAGYFTAGQANEAGYSHKNHAHYLKTGAWIREWRGIYRLARFPEPDDGQYALWSLWTRDRKGNMQGIYSHETALSMFDLSDVNPAKLHISVPRGFRKTAEIPEILVLHKKEISSSDYEQRTGYSVMKPLPNILMLIEEKRISEEILIQALRDGLAKGYLVKSQLLKLELPKKTRSSLHFLLEQVPWP